MSPIAVAYNLPGVDELNLSPATLAQIFAGTITKWNDDAIAADNPDADLPDTTSRRCTARTSQVRRRTSPTTSRQVAADDWTYGAVETWPIKGGEAADGTSGVVSAIGRGRRRHRLRRRQPGCRPRPRQHRRGFGVRRPDA